MIMNIDINNCLIKKVKNVIQHYDHDLYWKRRAVVVDPLNKISKYKKLYYLYYIKKCDAYNNASMGTDLNAGAAFMSPPILPHGLNGIIIAHDAVIGKNVTIYQQVTVGHKNNGAPKIGNNVEIGAGAKLLGNITIGNNTKIGANAVVLRNIPDGCLVAGVPAVIKRVYSERL